MRTQIAFATSAEFSHLAEDDRFAVNALGQRDIRVEAAVWDDKSVRWSDYAAVVIRSCWDYHLRPDEFSAWLGELEAAGGQVWNPVDVVNWNMDKTYLSDLQEFGVVVLPSVWLLQGAHVELRELMADKGWRRGVVKPTISAAANETFLVERDAPAEQNVRLNGLLQKGGAIVQEFAGEIQSRGEWSFLFFGGKYSHAVVKETDGGRLPCAA